MQTSRLVAFVAAGILCAIAVVGIVAVISSSGDDTTNRVTGAAVALTVLSLVAMTGIALANRRPPLAWIGYVTVAVAVATFALVARHIWNGHFLFSGDWELTWAAVYLALTCGQVSLLLAWARPTSPARWLAYATALAIGVFGALAVVMIVFEVVIADRVFAVLAILYLLGFALLPLFTLGSASSD